MSKSPNIYLNNPDALSSVLSRLDLKADVYVNGDFCGAWAMDTSGSRRILSLPFNRRTLQAAILLYKWCKPPTRISSTTLPFSIL